MRVEHTPYEVESHQPLTQSLLGGRGVARGVVSTSTSQPLQSILINRFNQNHLKLKVHECNLVIVEGGRGAPPSENPPFKSLIVRSFCFTNFMPNFGM